MNATSYLYISSHSLQGQGWSASLDAGGKLPSVPQIMENLDPAVFETEKLSVFLADDLLHPLRIELDEKVSSRELSQYLLWKLKRFLPMPIDQTAMRHFPLENSNSYMTFSLSSSWLTDFYDAMSAHNTQCGYIGGLFLTLLENRPIFRNKMTLVFFDDFYMLTEQDGKGGYLSFRTRRLPLDARGQLDVPTLANGDLASMMGDNPNILVLNFAPDLDPVPSQLVDALNAMGKQTHAPQLNGSNILDRFQFCMTARTGQL